MTSIYYALKTWLSKNSFAKEFQIPESSLVDVLALSKLHSWSASNSKIHWSVLNPNEVKSCNNIIVLLPERRNNFIP